MYYNPVPKPSKQSKDRAQMKQRKKLINQLKEELEEHPGCEVCYLEHKEGKRTKPNSKCWPLDPAHRHERRDYYSNPEMLWTRNQVIIAGRDHHQKMDRDKAYREEVFIKLRGKDEL